MIGEASTGAGILEEEAKVPEATEEEAGGGLGKEPGLGLVLKLYD